MSATRIRNHAGIALLLAILWASLNWDLAQGATDDHPDSGSAKTTNREDTSSVNSVALENIKRISNEIDRLINDQLESTQQPNHPRTSDEVFLRRVYLDIAGRIPTIQEATRFLESSSEGKRSELIDQLLDSYGYVSRQFNFFADLLRVQSRARNVNGQPYIDFIKDSLSENKPYDQFVRELLCASGPMIEKGNGATGYYLRDLGMPEDNMSNTIRIFLGTRLECAQCHDHPFDKWTQRQYFEMVAFTGGMTYRERGNNLGMQIQRAARQSDVPVDTETRQILRRILQPMTLSVEGSGTGLARLPEGFQGADGEEGEIVKAKTMFDSTPLVEPEIPKTRDSRVNPRRKKPKQAFNTQQIPGAREIDSRQAYAQWLTDSENPRFAQVIANRLWKQAMGLGLIEPVDIIEDQTTAANPELMEYLTHAMIDLDFDIKQYLRAIYNTNAYQAEATTSDIVDPAKYNFAGPVVRRMTAEQIWDSLLSMTVSDLDQRATSSMDRQRFLGGDIYQYYDKIKAMSADELLKFAQTLAGGDRDARRAMVMEMMSDQDVASPINARRQLQRQINEINVAIRKARRANDVEKIRELMIERTELMTELTKNRDNLNRASEMPSPAPPGHFLREFGQSDREQIDNSNSEPAVTQVLSLMNGFLEARIVRNPNTVLMRNVIAATGIEEKIDSIFLTILSRRPTSKEQQMWMTDFRRDPRTAMGDLIWTLVNSNEFIFVK